LLGRIPLREKDAKAEPGTQGWPFAAVVAGEVVLDFFFGLRKNDRFSPGKGLIMPKPGREDKFRLPGSSDTVS
jgi:hypothetical protein